MKHLATYLIIFIVFSGFTQKNKSSKLNPEVYVKEIPFNFEYGIPIIKATIKNKEYNFLFDTGMPTALSENIIKDFDLSSVRSTIGSDVNGNKQRENYVILDHINIGGIDFKNIETLTVDLNSGFEIGCLNLDGVIGNNLIKNAVWEIDYVRNVIRLTNDIDNFEIPNDAKKIRFKYNSRRNQYTPKVDIEINNKKSKNVFFDTGSNSGIKMPLKQYEKLLDPNQSVEYYGNSSAALYGKGKYIKYIDSKIKNIEIDGLKLQNEIVTFYDNSSLIGNKFLKNFRIILNYERSEIYMIRQKESIYTFVKNFGFHPSVNNNKAIVQIIFKNSVAKKKGLQLGDELLSVNSMNIPKLLSEDACSFIFDNPYSELDSISLTFARDGKEYLIDLEKETYIN